jgi:DNA invertase Pin-like site-specific DNA recombinase
MLVVAIQDRLTRSLSDWDGFVTGRIYGRRTPQLIIAESPNSSVFEMDLRAVFAKEERRKIGERTRKALAIKKEQGYVFGRVGSQVAADKARTETQDAIELAVQLRRNNLSYQKIADILNRKSYTTSRGTPWSRENIYSRLKEINNER